MEKLDIGLRFNKLDAIYADKTAIEECAKLSRDYALKINKIVPDSREKVIGMEKLEEVFFWFERAIARDTWESDNDSIV